MPRNTALTKDNAVPWQDLTNTKRGGLRRPFRLQALSRSAPVRVAVHVAVADDLATLVLDLDLGLADGVADGFGM